MSILGSLGPLLVFFCWICDVRLFLPKESLFRSMVPDPSVLQGEGRVTDGEREGHEGGMVQGAVVAILDEIGSIQLNCIVWDYFNQYDVPRKYEHETSKWAPNWTQQNLRVDSSFTSRHVMYHNSTMFHIQLGGIQRRLQCWRISRKACASCSTRSQGLGTWGGRNSGMAASWNMFLVFFYMLVEDFDDWYSMCPTVDFW